MPPVGEAKLEIRVEAAPAVVIGGHLRAGGVVQMVSIGSASASVIEAVEVEAIGAAFDQLDRKPIHIAGRANKAGARIAVRRVRASAAVVAACQRSRPPTRLMRVAAGRIFSEAACFDVICAGGSALGIRAIRVEAIAAVVVACELSAVRTVED